MVNGFSKCVDRKHRNSEILVLLKDWGLTVLSRSARTCAVESDKDKKRIESHSNKEGVLTGWRGRHDME